MRSTVTNYGKVLLLNIFFLLALAQATQAQMILFHDDFNDGEFSDWQVVRSAEWQNPNQPCLFYDQTAEWQIIDGELGIIIDSPRGCVTEIVPKNFNLSDQRAYRYEFDWHFKESIQMDRNVIIKWQDEANWYGLKILRDKVLLEKRVNGLKTTQYHNWGYYPFVADQTYHFVIEVVDNLITVWIEDQEIFQTVDHFPHLTGNYTIGLKASVGSIVRSASFFDNLLVTSLSSDVNEHLGVALFKQTDPDWQIEEYDHASQWAEAPTIGRWGCALSSAAMVLRYHGINQLPNGNPLDPSKLNRWLKNEPDGYVGEGLLNWLAITRLTHLLNDELNTPILEYSRLIKPSSEEVVSYLKKQLPVILQIPGHFLVTDGYQIANQELLIKDPAFNYQQLNQHQTQLISAGIFTPSKTDLSYFLIITEPGAKLTLFNQSDQKQYSLIAQNEYLLDLTSELQVGNKISQLSYLAKPTFGSYYLQAVSKNIQPTNVKILLYDQTGQVKIFEENFETVSIIEIDYRKDKDKTVAPLDNPFSHWQRELHRAYLSKSVVSYAFFDLDYLTFHAALTENPTDQDRYRQLLLNKLKQYQNLIDEESLKKLSRLLNEVDL